MYNYYYYTPILTECDQNKQKIINLQPFLSNIKMINNNFFRHSSPSFIFDKINNQYIINIRYVNYKIDTSNGLYTFYNNKKKLYTENICLIVDTHFNIKDTFIMKYNKNLEIGIEDIRLFNYKNLIYFVGNIKYNSNIKLSHGYLSL